MRTIERVLEILSENQDQVTDGVWVAVSALWHYMTSMASRAAELST